MVGLIESDVILGVDREVRSVNIVSLEDHVENFGLVHSALLHKVYDLVLDHHSVVDVVVQLDLDLVFQLARFVQQLLIFDRVREGLQTKRGEVKDIMNYSLNQTLGRTILTSATVLFTVIVLLLFGGPGLRGFSVVLLIGMIAGVYSTLFIASPIVLWWAKRSGTNLRRAVLDTEQSKIEGVTPAQA